MKNTYATILLLCLFVSPAFGLFHFEKANLFDHLAEVNKSWKFRIGAVAKESISFKSDIDRIQTHLLLVEKSLRSGDVSRLNQRQLSNRFKTLNILHQYALECKFPINTGHAVRQPYFIDDFRTYCAVGFLIKETGFYEISKAIAKTQNFAYLNEIVSPDLVRWSENFGFTLEELAWIQPGYAPTQSYSQVGGGTNGTVTHTGANLNRLLIGGEFSELDNLPCLNIGYYKNNQLGCFGSGIAGKIVGIAENEPNGVIVAGAFENNGQVYPIAKYDGSTWSYEGIPGLQNATATCFSSFQNSQFIEIAITAPAIVSGQQIWRFYAGQWSKKADVSGIVYAISNSVKDTYAGHFNAIEIFTNNLGTSYQATNFITYDYNSGLWESSLTNVPDTVRAIYTNGNSLFLGGVSPSTTNDVVLSKFLNGVAQPLLLGSNFGITQNAPEIFAINKLNSNALMIGGLFTAAPLLIGTFGNNLLSYDLVSSTYAPISLLDSTIFALSWMENRLYIGGAFTKNTWSSVNDKNHLVVLDGTADNPEESESFEFTLSPNPSNGIVQIDKIDIDLLKSVEIIDLQGIVCYSDVNTKLNLTHLNEGTYFVRVKTTKGAVVTRKLVKE